MPASPATHADLITALAVAETDLAACVRAAGRAVASGRAVYRAAVANEHTARTRVVAAGEALGRYCAALEATALAATEPAAHAAPPAAPAPVEPVAAMRGRVLAAVAVTPQVAPLAPLPRLTYLTTAECEALRDRLVAARPGSTAGAAQVQTVRDEIARRSAPVRVTDRTSHGGPLGRPARTGPLSRCYGAVAR